MNKPVSPSGATDAPTCEHGNPANQICQRCYAETMREMGCESLIEPSPEPAQSQPAPFAGNIDTLKGGLHDLQTLRSVSTLSVDPETVPEKSPGAAQLSGAASMETASDHAQTWLGEPAQRKEAPTAFEELLNAMTTPLTCMTNGQLADFHAARDKVLTYVAQRDARIAELEKIRDGLVWAVNQRETWQSAAEQRALDAAQELNVVQSELAFARNDYTELRYERDRLLAELGQALRKVEELRGKVGTK